MSTTMGQTMVKCKSETMRLQLTVFSIFDVDEYRLPTVTIIKPFLTASHTDCWINFKYSKK